MKFIGLVAAAACLVATAPAMAQQLAPSPTLDAVKARGHIECGVHLGLPGFSFANDKGEWAGLDVDYCKSLAAAVLGDATKVKYTPTSVQQQPVPMQSGQVDPLLARNTTITFSRNATLGVNFQGINSLRGARPSWCTKAKVAKVADSGRYLICVAAGSTEKTAADWFPRAQPQGLDHQFPEERRRDLRLRSGPLRPPIPPASARWPASASRTSRTRPSTRS